MYSIFEHIISLHYTWLNYFDRTAVAYLLHSVFRLVPSISRASHSHNVEQRTSDSTRINRVVGIVWMSFNTLNYTRKQQMLSVSERKWHFIFPPKRCSFPTLILMRNRKQGWDLNSMAQDRTQWWDSANKDINLGDPYKAMNILNSWGISVPWDKGKVALCLITPWKHMGVDVHLNEYLISALNKDLCQLHAQATITRGKNPLYPLHWARRLGCLNTVAKKTCRETNRRHLVVACH